MLYTLEPKCLLLKSATIFIVHKVLIINKVLIGGRGGKKYGGMIIM